MHVAVSRRPIAVPPAGDLPLGVQVLLASEILRSYVPLARLVRTNDLERMVGYARRPARAGTVPPADARGTAVRLGWIVARLLRALPTDGRCLVRSLVVLRLLADRGIPARLVIGVRTGTDFGAHAWVEYAGRPVLPWNGYQRLLEL